MRRTFLVSFLVIGAALAVLFGGGTFSAFTDVENIGTTATSAIVDFELTGDGTTTGTNEAGTASAPSTNENLVISFNASPCVWAFFAPGDSCVIPITMTRDPATIAQQLAVDLVLSGLTAGGVADGAGTDGDAGAGAIGVDCDGSGVGAGNGPDWHVTFVFRDDDSAIENRMPAATADLLQFVDVTVSLDGDTGNNCQNNVLGSIAGTVTANQAATPHLATYD